MRVDGRLCACGWKVVRVWMEGCARVDRMPCFWADKL